jgi:hypothetical protein
MLAAMFPLWAASLAVLALACESEPAPLSAPGERTRPSTEAAAPAVAATPRTVPAVADTQAAVPKTGASASVAAQPAPLSSASPVVPKSERDPSVELCCKMFDPYVTGCVAGGVCYGEIRDYCRNAWKRGASLNEIEPGLRRMVQRRRYFMPKPCLRRVASP